MATEETEEPNADAPFEAFFRSLSGLDPIRVTGAGFALGIIAMYLPWWGLYVDAPRGFFGGPAFTGFSEWGIGYFIVWLGGTGLYIIRTVCRDADLGVRLPVADWFGYAAAGTLMGLFALTVPDSLLVGGGTVDLSPLRYGWVLAMIAAILVLVGGLIMRTRSMRGE